MTPEEVRALSDEARVEASKVRTQEEIVARYEEKKADDWLGVIGGDLLVYCDYEHVKPYLKADATPDDWKPQALTVEAVRQQLIDYLPFAWEKARGERGISASRSIQHFESWLWLLGDDELLAFAEDEGHYEPYGKPILLRITAKYAPSAAQHQEEMNDAE